MNKTPKSDLPPELDVVLKEQFSFPEKHLYGSVATIGNNHPRIRTMRIYAINHGCLILITHVESNKWKELVHHPYLSINMVSENKLTQLIAFGSVILDTPKSASNMAKQYWNMLREDVKKIYDPRHAMGKSFCEVNNLAIPQDVPDTFGIASLNPSFWEILHLDSEYTKSRRYQFQVKNGAWQKQRINVG